MIRLTLPTEKLWSLFTKAAGECNEDTHPRIRNALCIVRGYLELDRDHGQPVDLPRTNEIMSSIVKAQHP